MSGVTDWLAIIVALLGVLSSCVVAYLVYASTRQAQRAEIQRQIGFLYDKLMDFRAEHPEVLVLSRRWSEACFGGIYRQTTEEDREWVLYYTYAEMCCGFSNAVIYGRRIRLLDKHAYEEQYKPLVRLLLTEHYPFICSVIHGKYLSPFIVEFLAELEKQGWDWQEMHELLSGGSE